MKILSKAKFNSILNGKIVEGILRAKRFHVHGNFVVDSYSKIFLYAKQTNSDGDCDHYALFLDLSDQGDIALMEKIRASEGCIYNELITIHDIRASVGDMLELVEAYQKRQNKKSY